MRATCATRWLDSTRFEALRTLSAMLRGGVFGPRLESSGSKSTFEDGGR